MTMEYKTDHQELRSLIKELIKVVENIPQNQHDFNKYEQIAKNTRLEEFMKNRATGGSNEN